MPIVKTDRFGRSYQNVKCTDKKDSGFFAGHVELGGKLYKVEPGSEKSEDNKTGKPIMWVRITRVQKQIRNRSM